MIVVGDEPSRGYLGMLSWEIVKFKLHRIVGYIIILKKIYKTSFCLSF